MPRKTRRRAWDSVTETTRGKKYVLRWVENTPDGRKRKSKTVYGTYREACNALAKIQVTKADACPMPTIGQAYEAWRIPWANRKWNSPDKGTRRLYERAWKNYCKDRWSHVPLDQVRPLDVQEWLFDISKSTAKIALGVPRRTVDLAVSYEVVSENKFRRQYELGEHIPFSSLRNSWRTFAQYEWGISSETLEVLMGHKLPGTSGRHYIRPSLELLAESFTRDYVKNTRS